MDIDSVDSLTPVQRVRLDLTVAHVQCGGLSARAISERIDRLSVYVLTGELPELLPGQYEA